VLERAYAVDVLPVPDGDKQVDRPPARLPDDRHLAQLRGVVVLAHADDECAVVDRTVRLQRQAQDALVDHSRARPLADRRLEGDDAARHLLGEGRRDRRGGALRRRPQPGHADQPAGDARPASAA
jgi:hypothetical protein